MSVADRFFDLLYHIFACKDLHQLKSEIECSTEPLPCCDPAVCNEALACQFCTFYDSFKVRMAGSLLAFKKSERGKQRRSRTDRISCLRMGLPIR